LACGSEEHHFDADDLYEYLRALRRVIEPEAPRSLPGSEIERLPLTVGATAARRDANACMENNHKSGGDGSGAAHLLA
jgi:hypothetical protein